MIDPDGIVTNWNLGAQRFKGYKPDEIVGQPFSRFFTDRDRQDASPSIFWRPRLRKGRYESEGWRVRKDGQRFWAHVVVDTIREADGQLLGFAKITRDVSERRKNEERLNHLAHYDPLTQLPNRATLRNSLEDTMLAGPVTVLMLDLDGFKDINDTLGHPAGDCILRDAGERLRYCLGDRGTIGRLGGDEFAVVVSGLSGPLRRRRSVNNS